MTLLTTTELKINLTTMSCIPELVGQSNYPIWSTWIHSVLQASFMFEFVNGTLTYNSLQDTADQNKWKMLDHHMLGLMAGTVNNSLTSRFWLGWPTELSFSGECYRCLGLPTLFPHPILSTIPLPMEHDNQWQRDLLRDLGSVCRWQCSEHHLLKAESTTPLLSISFSFWTYLYHCQHDYVPHCFVSSCLHSCVSMIYSSFSPHNHAYFYMSFLFTLIDIASSAALSLCAAS